MSRETPPLLPLGPDERPRTLIVAIAIAVLLAVAVFVCGLILPAPHRGASLPGGIFLTAVLLVIAWSMYRRRYWAVLGFEMLIGFQIMAAAMALMLASTVRAAVVCVLAMGLGGWLFWKLVRVMGRIQATDRARRLEAVEEARRFG